jgi:hypothetical protein
VCVVAFRVLRRIAQGDQPREHVVEPVTGTQREARRLARRHPVQIDAREAIGLLFVDDRGVAFGDEFRHVLQGVPVFVCKRPRDRHVAEIALRVRKQLPAIPEDHVAATVVGSVDAPIGLGVADGRAVGVLGVVGDQLVDGREFAPQVLAVDRLPVLLDVVDGQQRQFVDLPVIGVLYLARGRGCFGTDPAGAVGRGQVPDPERVVQDRHRPSRHDGGASRYHEQHRRSGDRRTQRRDRPAVVHSANCRDVGLEPRPKSRKAKTKSATHAFGQKNPKISWQLPLLIRPVGAGVSPSQIMLETLPNR